MGQIRISGQISGRAAAQLALAGALSLLAANCSVGPMARLVDPVYGVPASPRVVEEGQVVPKGGGVYRVGNTYTVAGRTYTPQVDPNYRAEGVASWYGRDFHGRRTANGEIFDMDSLTAAHPTLPIPSYVRVTNLANRRSVIVRINDRGPFKDNRIIDLSKKSADVLGFRGNGLARVRVEYVGRASLDGSDDRKLMATLRHDGQPAPAPSNVMLASAGGPFVPVTPEAVPARRVADVPTPSVRPFELGRYSSNSAPAAVAPSQPAQMAAMPTHQPRAAFGGAGNEPRYIPVSAMSPAVGTGRGLY